MSEDLQDMINNIPAWQLDSETATVSEVIGSVMDVLRVMASRLADAEEKIEKFQNSKLSVIRCNECWNIDCSCLNTRRLM